MIRNKTVVTEEKFLKFNSDMFKQRTLSSVLLGVIGMVIGLVCVVLGILLENLLIPGICVGAVFIILFGVILFLPNIAKNNAKKVFSENYKGKSQAEHEYEFDEDGLTVCDGKGHVLADGEYENIEQVLETPTDFYLLADVRACVGFIVDKNGFTEGDAEQLADVLKKAVPDYVVLDSKK